MKNKKGISLIVLVITILVMIILAGVVIVNMAENNPIEKSKEAAFKQNLNAIGSELDLFIANKTSENPLFSKNTLYANNTECRYNTKTGEKEKSVIDVLPLLKSSKYKNQIEIIAGNLYYKTPNKSEIPWLQDMGINFTGIVTGTVNIEGDTLLGVSSDYVNTGTLIVPATVKKISPGAFANCDKINAVIFQEPTDGTTGITEIPDNCFRKATMLTAVTLPSTVKTIGNNAFRDCKALKSVVIPRDTTVIKGSAFQDCDELTTVKFNDKLTQIWEYAFLNDKKLKELNLPATMELVKRQAFQNTAITKMVFPDGITRIGYAALLGCPELTEVQIGSKVETIEEAVFRECPKLNKIVVNNNKKYSSDGQFVLYEQRENQTTHVVEKVLKSVAQAATSVTIDPDTKIISPEAFIFCKSIKKVDIPEGVREIKSRVFSNCSSLTELIIPGSVTTIETRVIEQTPLLNITIKPNAQGKQNFIAENGAIYNSTKGVLISASNAVRPNSEFIIPDTVKWIDYCAFYGALNLEKIIIPEGVTNIAGDAFSGTGITEIVIPKTAEEVGWNIVRYSKNCKRVVFKEGCKAPIPGYILAGLTDATLVVPESTDYINPSSMALSKEGCKVEINPLNQKYKVDSGKYIINKITNRLVSAFNLSNFETIPNVSGIETEAFREMATGEKITIPNTVTSLPSKLVLDNSRIKEIVLPASITEIAPDAFISAVNLAKIYMGSKEGSIKGSPWGATQGLKAIIWK